MSNGQGSPALGKFYIVTDGGWQVSITTRVLLSMVDTKMIADEKASIQY